MLRRQLRHILFTEPEVLQAGKKAKVYYCPDNTCLAGKEKIYFTGGEWACALPWQPACSALLCLSVCVPAMRHRPPLPPPPPPLSASWAPVQCI